MTDRELLELSAKAAGYNMAKVLDGYPMYMEGYGIWNPLTDDGDALRLAVKLELEMYTGHDEEGIPSQYVGYPGKQSGRILFMSELHDNDPFAATRRAIVRAAAEIGKNA